MSECFPSDPRNADRFTDAAIQDAQPRAKPYKIYDSRGLILEVMPTGAKYWRLKYRFNRKERRVGLGVFPKVTIDEARIARDEARKLLASGVDPVQARRAGHGDFTHATFGLSFDADGSLLIHVNGEGLALSPHRVSVLRTFLTVPDEVTHVAD